MRNYGPVSEAPVYRRDFETPSKVPDHKHSEYGGAGMALFCILVSVVFSFLYTSMASRNAFIADCAVRALQHRASKHWTTGFVNLQCHYTVNGRTYATRNMTP